MSYQKINLIFLPEGAVNREVRKDRNSFSCSCSKSSNIASFQFYSYCIQSSLKDKGASSPVDFQFMFVWSSKAPPSCKIWLTRFLTGLSSCTLVRSMVEILTRYSQEVKTKNFTSNLRKSRNFGKRFSAIFNQYKRLLKGLI